MALPKVEVSSDASLRDDGSPWRKPDTVAAAS